jgi:hypothetical protein
MEQNPSDFYFSNFFRHVKYRKISNHCTLGLFGRNFRPFPPDRPSSIKSPQECSPSLLAKCNGNDAGVGDGFTGLTTSG